MRKAVRVAVVLVIWLPVLAAGSRLASGQQANFGGYLLGASGSGVTWVYDNPESGIPASPTGELHAAFAQAELDSGPSSYALASWLWPGQTAANLPSFIVGEIERGSEGQCCPFPFDIPNYPVRAEAAFPQGPQDAGSESAGARMTAGAHQHLSTAVAHLAGSGFPGVGTVGAVSAFSRNSAERDVAVAEARSSAHGISMFGGLIEIDAVVTRAAATSDGVDGAVSGRTVVSGARIAGQEVAIDNEGIHLFGESSDPGSSIPMQQILGALAENGITITLADPIDTIEGPVASRALGGLLVRIEGTALRGYVSNLPPELLSEIDAAVNFEQHTSVSFASAVVRSGASLPATLPPLTPPERPVAGTPGQTTVVEDFGEVQATRQPGLLPAQAVTEEVSGPLGGTLAAAPVPFEGVPVAVVIGLILAAMAATVPLVRFADRLFAGRTTGCPYGKG